MIFHIKTSFFSFVFFSSLETPLYGLDERWLCSNCTSATTAAAANNIFNCFHFEDDLMMTWKDVYYYFFKCVSFKNVVRKETAGYSNGGIATSIERPPLLTDSPIKTARKPHNKGELCYENRQTDRRSFCSFCRKSKM